MGAQGWGARQPPRHLALTDPAQCRPVRPAEAAGRRRGRTVALQGLAWLPAAGRPGEGGRVKADGGEGEGVGARAGGAAAAEAVKGGGGGGG